MCQLYWSSKVYLVTKTVKKAILRRSVKVFCTYEILTHTCYGKVVSWSGMYKAGIFTKPWYCVANFYHSDLQNLQGGNIQINYKIFRTSTRYKFWKKMRYA